MYLYRNSPDLSVLLAVAYYYERGPWLGCVREFAWPVLCIDNRWTYYLLLTQALHGKKNQLELEVLLSRTGKITSLSSISRPPLGPGWSGLGFHSIPVKSHQVIYSVYSKPGGTQFFIKILFQVHWQTRTSSYIVKSILIRSLKFAHSSRLPHKEYRRTCTAGIKTSAFNYIRFFYSFSSRFDYNSRSCLINGMRSRPKCRSPSHKIMIAWTS